MRFNYFFCLGFDWVSSFLLMISFLCSFNFERVFSVPPFIFIRSNIRSFGLT